MSSQQEYRSRLFSTLIRIFRQAGIALPGAQIDNIRKELGQFIDDLITLIKYETLATMITTDIDKLKKNINKPEEKEKTNEDVSNNKPKRKDKENAGESKSI